ncbi:hypothetical protein BH09BAC5_BH09BAC5_12960 [soil metagenome]
MKREIVVRELAANNLVTASSWYEEQQTGLGNAFLNEWESVFRKRIF